MLGLRGAWRTRGPESLLMARARELLSLYGCLRCPKSRKATQEAGRKGVRSIRHGMNWRDLRTWAGELVRSPKEVFREHHRRSKGLHRCYTETDRFHHPRCGLSFIPSNPGPFKTDMPCVVSVNKVSPDFPLSTISILEVLCLLLFTCVVVDIRDSLFL